MTGFSLGETCIYECQRGRLHHMVIYSSRIDNCHQLSASVWAQILGGRVLFKKRNSPDYIDVRNTVLMFMLLRTWKLQYYLSLCFFFVEFRNRNNTECKHDTPRHPKTGLHTATCFHQCCLHNIVLIPFTHVDVPSHVHIIARRTRETGIRIVGSSFQTSEDSGTVGATQTASWFQRVLLGLWPAL